MTVTDRLKLEQDTAWKMRAGYITKVAFILVTFIIVLEAAQPLDRHRDHASSAQKINFLQEYLSSKGKWKHVWINHEA